MRRSLTAAALAALLLVVSACGSGYGSTPTGPNNTPPPGAIVIDIVGINGARSFSPNPSTVPAGQMFVWHNVDTVTHRVVLDDGRLDAGNIAAGVFQCTDDAGRTGLLSLHDSSGDDRHDCGRSVRSMMDTGRRFDLDACQPGCCGVLCESQLPSSLLEALRKARAARPDRDVLCVEYRTEEDGREVARIGSACRRLDVWAGRARLVQIRAKDVIVHVGCRDRDDVRAREACLPYARCSNTGSTPHLRA